MFMFGRGGYSNHFLVLAFLALALVLLVLVLVLVLVLLLLLFLLFLLLLFLFFFFPSFCLNFFLQLRLMPLSKKKKKL